MIPYEAALLGWIPLSALFMMSKDNVRGFCMAFVLGYAVLPSGADIDLSGVPSLDQSNVPAIGVLIGTVLFHADAFDRFQFSVGDLLLLIITAIAFLTSVFNGFGPYDGLSQSLSTAMGFLLPIFLARIHLTTPRALRTFFLWIIGVALVYAPFALYEFRMSPQVHQTVYGYFQHVMAQHFRGGFWRPIVMFTHALELGRFFAVAAFLALFPLRKHLQARFGLIGGWLFLAPLGGLVLSQSFGPYLFFVLSCAGYQVALRSPRWLYVLPTLAMVWLSFVLAGFNPGFNVVESISNINEDRAGSLEYRLRAWQEYRSVIMYKPLFGHGGWGAGRIEGRATDSEALIAMLHRGIIGYAFYIAWFMFGMHKAISVTRRTRGTPVGQMMASIAVLSAIAIVVTVIDAAIDPYLIFLLAMVYPLEGFVARQQALQRSKQPVLKPAGQGG